MTIAIGTQALAKSFGRTRALDGIDLEVPSGTMLGLLGPNGSGKTTAVRILATLLTPTSGRASVGGYDIVHQAAQVRTVIGLTGQYAVDFVVPGVVVQFLAYTMLGTALGMHDDISNGIVDRFRSLPIARSAVLSGRIISDTIRCVLAVVLLVTVGALLGFRFSTGAVAIVGAFLLTTAFGMAMAWVGPGSGWSCTAPRRCSQWEPSGWCR